TGTGVYLPGRGLVITNEHVVRDNATVVIGSEKEQQQLATVTYLDPYYDLAFLVPERRIELPVLPLANKPLEAGQTVKALGQISRKNIRTSEGIVLELAHPHHGIDFVLHDAWQEAEHSGGPLFNTDGELVGINMYDIQEAKGKSLSLPIQQVVDCLDRYAKGNGRPASRCFNCQEVIFEVVLNPTAHCPSCGSEITLPDAVEDYTPTGIPATVEAIIKASGHDPRLARRGPNLWSIRQGSAIIQLAYHEDSGLVTGDAYLCSLPDLPNPELFAFLLKENFKLQQLTFSTFGRDIVLSLLIYDRYLTVETALPHFEHLFKKADDYDNVLVEGFGGKWLG
ncbi:MAG: serine protease, partial [Bacteroidota bacterium]